MDLRGNVCGSSDKQRSVPFLASPAHDKRFAPPTERKTLISTSLYAKSRPGIFALSFKV
jgi:hypothetical protein